MIDKQEFYHGAALIRLLDDKRCRRVQKYDCGHSINDEAFVFLKYSTKSRSPWRFNFSDNDIGRLNYLASSFRKMVAALVCDGDGICPISWKNCEILLGKKAGWIAVRRGFNEQYAVAGSEGTLRRKVSLQEWPSAIF